MYTYWLISKNQSAATEADQTTGENRQVFRNNQYVVVSARPPKGFLEDLRQARKSGDAIDVSTGRDDELRQFVFAEEIESIVCNEGDIRVKE
jgi:hypothetical protein